MGPGHSGIRHKGGIQWAIFLVICVSALCNKGVHSNFSLVNMGLFFLPYSKQIPPLI
jgi:hypothetical protein